MPEGGMHGHRVDRAELRTANDGAHRHLFEVDGELVETESDGDHFHRLRGVEDAFTQEDGDHSHRVNLAGESLTTGDQGAHMHPVAVKVTGVGGAHVHELDLASGGVTSLTAAQFWRRFVEKGGLLRLAKRGESHVEFRVPLHKLYDGSDTDEDDNEVDSRLDEALRLVGGVVLEPGVVDLQNDVMSAEEIRRVAHEFAAALNAGTGTDLMHEVEFPPGVSIVESYIAPVDFEMGDQQVKAGSWVMWMHITDDEIWAQVLNGDIDGFSIRGTGRRVPVDGPVE